MSKVNMGIEDGATGGQYSNPQSPRVGTDCLCHFKTRRQTVCHCEMRSLAIISQTGEVLLKKLIINLLCDQSH